jgi:diguanylate cyclase (GGDEF)-like protein
MSISSSSFGSPVRFRYILPAAATLAATAVIVAALFAWSSFRADSESVARQESLVSLVLEQSIARVPHDQESSTVWDDAVRAAEARTDLDWFDQNLGIWMHSYFGIDRVYVLDPTNEAFYAMVDGTRVDPAGYDKIRKVVEPLAQELRRDLAAPHASRLDATVLTQGVADLQIVDGHPAIVSVKPIVSDTGKIEQTPGAESLHVAVRYLDGTFVSNLAKNYLFEGAHFTWSDERAAGERSYRLRTRAGTTLGYVVWRPYLPGSIVLASTVPALIAALVAIGMILFLLLATLKRSALALQASEAQAQHLAFHDSLTGLPNRALFNDRLDRALADVRGSGSRLALLYLDLDRFKQVNDTLGHPAGDELIREVGRRLTEAVRDCDTVARLGGDEFAIIQTDIRAEADVLALCGRVEAAVRAPFHLVGSQAFVGVSIGVAMAPADGTDRVEVSRKADIALYNAKADGRGRTVVFREDMDETLQRRRAIERDLRSALRAGNQLHLVYQPLYSARGKEITGVEALVRWVHPVHGLMSPSVFIPVAEESGLIDALGDWVLRTACAAAAAWEGRVVSVNASAVQLRNSGFGQRVLAIARRTGMDPSRLQIEITETALVESLDIIRPTIALLRDAGVRIALDDFGTGYSSLSHLRQFQVDRVKIDRSFVHGLDKSIGGEAIIQAIVDLARGTGLQITAEGVETNEQRRYLSEIGCDELQGFLLGRPIPIEEMDALLGVDRQRLHDMAAERRDAA